MNIDLDAALLDGRTLPTILAAYRPAWMADALCNEYPRALFFPTRGGTMTRAKAICAACVVRSECIDYALVDIALQGVWGGHQRPRTPPAPGTARRVNPGRTWHTNVAGRTA